jgi:hypothetical protein
MPDAPQGYVEHLKGEGYHPRSDKHSNALCKLVLEDLLERCPLLKKHAEEGEVVYSLNHTVHAGPIQWNVDIVIGPPAFVSSVGSPPESITEAVPATVRIACEVKSLMTEHGKARKNRLRDFDSLHTYIHRAEGNAIAAALLVINISERFRSPLRKEDTKHHDIRRLVKETIGLFKALPARTQVGGDGLEANGIIVVEFDNIDLRKGRLWSRSPAPQPGDPAHYDSFIRQICNRYEERWG